MHNWIVYHTYPQEAVILGLGIANRRANRVVRLNEVIVFYKFSFHEICN